jgi:hypothetical protein
VNHFSVTTTFDCRKRLYIPVFLLILYMAEGANFTTREHSEVAVNSLAEGFGRWRSPNFKPTLHFSYAEKKYN